MAQRRPAKILPTKASVDDFIEKVEIPTRRADAKSLLTLYEKATGVDPVMWGPAIVGFGQYSFDVESGDSGILYAVGFSPRKANLSLHLAPSIFDDPARLKKLGPHRASATCLYITNLKDIEIDVLHAMIEDSFHLRNDEDNEADET